MESIVQAVRNLSKRKNLELPDCKFYGERDTVQSLAHLQDHGPVLVIELEGAQGGGRSIHEESHAVVVSPALVRK
jgi:hypothetical protein